MMVNGDSAYNLRHKKGHFAGLRIPFGAKVTFKPQPVKQKGIDIPKMADNTKTGVFLGYYLAPGGKWTNEYIVADLEEFVGMDLRVGRKVKTQRIQKIVNWDDKNVVFPLKAAYERANHTLEGLSQPYTDNDPKALGIDVALPDDVTLKPLGLPNSGLDLSLIHISEPTRPY